MSKDVVMRSFSKSRFLTIYPKISTVPENRRYFEIILKNSSFVHISENINISRNTTLFSDHFEKNPLLSISPKISTFRGKRRYFEINECHVVL